MAKRRPQPQRRTCIFCGNHNLSKEHIYSAWIGPLLPDQGVPFYNEEQHTTIGKVWRLPPDIRKRPGHVTTKKVRAACTVCNNGWMNRVEGLAKPILTPIITGGTVTLNPASQEIIARWIAMKVVVGEHAKPDMALTPQSDRTALMESGIIPDYFTIYAARHSGKPSVIYERHAVTGSLTYSGPIPALDGMGKNMQQISMLIGPLFVQVNAVRLDGFRFEDRLNPSLYAGIRIWPIERETFDWSESRRLTADDVAKLAASMEALMAAPNVKWGGMSLPG